MEPPELHTPRLRLRAWQASDLQAFAALNAAAEVMTFFRAMLTRRQSDDFARAADKKLRDRGFGLWAVETRGGASFIGFVGLDETNFPAHFTPCIEIGWRLARHHWGRGYATEAAKAALGFAFGSLGIEEVVSFTAHHNLRSRAVMERIGMHRSPKDDFDYPRFPEGHPLRRHVLWRVNKHGSLDRSLMTDASVRPRRSWSGLRSRGRARFSCARKFAAF